MKDVPEPKGIIRNNGYYRREKKLFLDCEIYFMEEFVLYFWGL